MKLFIGDVENGKRGGKDQNAQPCVYAEQSDDASTVNPQKSINAGSGWNLPLHNLGSLALPLPRALSSLNQRLHCLSILLPFRFVLAVRNTAFHVATSTNRLRPKSGARTGSHSVEVRKRVYESLHVWIAHWFLAEWQQGETDCGSEFAAFVIPALLTSKQGFYGGVTSGS
jgi:hypothetical protein